VAAVPGEHRRGGRPEGARRCGGRGRGERPRGPEHCTLAVHTASAGAIAAAGAEDDGVELRGPSGVGQHGFPQPPLRLGHRDLS